MKYGTICLVPVLVMLEAIVFQPVTGAKHVDIFQQFEDGSYEANQQSSRDELDASENEDDLDSLRTEQPSSCVEDVLPTDPLELHEKLENETVVPQTAVKNVSQPDLREMFSSLTKGFFNTNIFRIGQHVREVLISIKNRVQTYTNDTIAKLDHLRYRAMSAVKRKVDEVNAQVCDHFRNEFVEYRNVCLPDDNRCMKVLHAQIDQYEQRLRANMDQCHDKLAEHLAEQRREVNAAQRLMNGPYNRMNNCLNRDAGVGRSFLACTGGAVANLAKFTTESMQSFANKMNHLSDKFATRVDKFEKCVVKRRQLLQQNEREVSEKVKGCFVKQQSEPENFF